MEGISKEDKEFVRSFLSEELSELGLEHLEERLKDPAFEAYYQKALDEKYKGGLLQSFFNYLPMIVFVLLTLVGLFLILKK